jgi:LPS sulfotransferase NodH
MATHNRLGYFDARFDNNALTEPRYRYVIFSSQRTGSNYLCARLNNVRDRLGIPIEYLHPDAIRLMGARLFPGVQGAISLDSYLHAVSRIRATRDGWFGTKIQPHQLAPLVGGDFNSVVRFLGRFDRLIFMARRDKLRQAISGAIAHATGVWFNFGTEPTLAENDIAQFFPHIDRLQLRYLEEERLMKAVCTQLKDRPLLQIDYEDILKQPEVVFQRVGAFLGAEGAMLTEEKVTTPPTRKPPGALAEQIRAAYLRYAADGE